MQIEWPQTVYVEIGCEKYAFGREMIERFEGKGAKLIEVGDHNNIPEMRAQPNAAFPKMKRAVVLGIRKSLVHRKNNKTSDFLVPYTSSGCTAMCLYCYLVCTYFKCAYLRIFVNRRLMMEKLKRAVQKHPGSVFEIGSNSDLVLENAYTGSLEWTIREFADVREARLTLPTKFGMAAPLLGLPHGGNVTIRMSLNPEEIIRRVELKTSPLEERIDAVNKLYLAGYDVGILIAPIILLDGYQTMYERLLQTMADQLLPQIKEHLLLELIYMTYGTVTKQINSEAFPNAEQLYDERIMAHCGRSRYGYTQGVKVEASRFVTAMISRYLPEARIAYIV